MSDIGSGHGEIEELLGAYALGAVGRDERILVEEHLPTCPTCVIELADHLRVGAALLADSGLRPSDVQAGPYAAAPRTRRVVGFVAALVAVAVLNVVLITVTARGEKHQVNALSHQISQAQLVEQGAIALANPANHRIQFFGTNNRPVLTAVARPDGTALAVDTALPPSERTKPMSCGASLTSRSSQ